MNKMGFCKLRQNMRRILCIYFAIVFCIVNCTSLAQEKNPRVLVYKDLATKSPRELIDLGKKYLDSGDHVLAIVYFSESKLRGDDEADELMATAIEQWNEYADDRYLNNQDLELIEVKYELARQFGLNAELEREIAVLRAKYENTRMALQRMATEITQSRSRGNNSYTIRYAREKYTGFMPDDLITYVFNEAVNWGTNEIQAFQNDPLSYATQMLIEWAVFKGLGKALRFFRFRL